MGLIMIKLKKILKEGYVWDRKFGEPLPTLEDVVKKHNVKEETKTNLPARAAMMFKDPRKHFIKYACEWREDFIKIYYDGKLVRTITDEKVLKDMNKPQRIIINNHLTEKGLDKVGRQGSDFQIRYFKYEK